MQGCRKSWIYKNMILMKHKKWSAVKQVMPIDKHCSLAGRLHFNMPNSLDLSIDSKKSK